MSKRARWLLGGGLLLLAVLGLGGIWLWQTFPQLFGKSGYYGNVRFKDDVKTNTQVQPGALDLTFVDRHGRSVDLRSFRGQKNLVVVMMRGFPGYLCLNCTGQTARLIQNYEEFQKRGAEVLVIFPGKSGKVDAFVQASQSLTDPEKPAPFPVLLDQDRKVVDQLGISGDEAKPSTYIMDKKGEIRFAYVGATATDRPSVKAMLAQLDEINKSN